MSQDAARRVPGIWLGGWHCMSRVHLQFQGWDIRLAEEMPLPADTGIAGHGDCEPSAHSLGAEGHGVLLGKCAASLHSESRSEYHCDGFLFFPCHYYSTSDRTHSFYIHSFIHSFICHRRYINLSFHRLTNSMQQNPSWEANRSSASQKIYLIAWNPMVYYCIQNSLPSIPILSQIDLVHAVIPLLEDPF